MSVWHPSSSFTPIVDLVKGFRSAPFISLVIAVNVDKSLTACLLLEYDFYFVFSVYLGQKVGCILTLGECVCVCACVFLTLCRSLSPKHTNIHLPACVCVYITRVHTNIYPHTDVCVYTQRYTHISVIHTPTLTHLICNYLRHCVHMCMCVHTHTVLCAYVHTQASLATPINIPSPPSRGCMQL